MRQPVMLALASVLALAACGGSDSYPTPRATSHWDRHRGAPGYLPRPQPKRYAKAIELGADFIEPRPGGHRAMAC